MVFKRRDKLTWFAWAREWVYPAGGFKRATMYLIHRMRRLPDEPHRIARGVFAGTFVNFPPIFGIQFISAAAFAYVIRGNILAAVLCTFLSNPITTPFIAIGCLQLGYWMLGMTGAMDIHAVFRAFTGAGEELWSNFLAIFTTAPTHWQNLGQFWRTIYFPYLVGSIIPGIIFSLVAYYMTIPLVKAYQKLRAGKLRDRIEKRRRIKAALLEAEERASRGGDDGGSEAS